MTIKKMTIKEFRELGYLQEVNRLFFHPLGLALEVTMDSFEETISGVWDYRDDPNGIIYDLKNSSSERIKKFKEKSEYVKKCGMELEETRKNNLGFVIEPIPD